MAARKNSDNPSSPGHDRRKKARRLGTERRGQPRWDDSSPIRRQGPGRRALDRLLSAIGLLRK